MKPDFFDNQAPAGVPDGPPLLITGYTGTLGRAFRVICQLRGLHAVGLWSGEPGTTLLDGGAPFYDTYTCADGRHVAVGALEPQFFAALVDGLGLDAATMPAQTDATGWSRWREVLTATFATKTRDEWAQLFDGTDACVTPVLTPWEAPHHPHAVGREAFVDVDGVTMPAPAPRFGGSD